VTDEQMPLADWQPEDDELRELLARPLEVPAAAPSTLPAEQSDGRALVGPVPGPAASSVALVELEAASVEAVRTLRWALHHAAADRDRITAARSILAFNLGVWQQSGKVVDPLGAFVKAVTVPNGKQG
jgi:hypothetical protein